MHPSWLISGLGPCLRNSLDKYHPPKTARRQQFPQGCLAENNKILRIPPPCVMAVASPFRAGTTRSSLTAEPSPGFPITFQDAPLLRAARLQSQTRVYTLTGPPRLMGGRWSWRWRSSREGVDDKAPPAVLVHWNSDGLPICVQIVSFWRTVKISLSQIPTP